jgi:hypothetical protein
VVFHERLEVPAVRDGCDLFGHFYRVGERAEEVPLLCYWGGAISPTEYDARRRTEPMPVVVEFEAAIEGAPAVSVDLLILADPPIWAGERNGAERRVATRSLFHEILDRGPNPRPPVLGYIGNSAGAYHVTCLALDLPESRAVATIAGFGMSEALADTGSGPLNRQLDLISFVNVDDPAMTMADAFQAELGARGIVLPVQVGRGGHAYQDYVANGAVRTAFKWVLNRIALRR